MKRVLAITLAAAAALLTALGLAGCVSATTPYTATCRDLGSGWVSYTPYSSSTILKQVKDAIACGASNAGGENEVSLVVTWYPNGGISEIRGHYTFTHAQP